MKKILLLLLVTFCFEAKSQMIIHGTNAIKFYILQDSVLYLFTADEIWVHEPVDTSESLNIVYSINSNLTPVAAYSNGADPNANNDYGDLYISCYEAQRYYNSGSCGPLIYTYDGLGNLTGSTCNGTNSNGCSVKVKDNNGNWVIFYSSDGHF